jgi:hypothetical protein
MDTMDIIEIILGKSDVLDCREILESDFGVAMHTDIFTECEE